MWKEASQTNRICLEWSFFSDPVTNTTCVYVHLSICALNLQAQTMISLPGSICVPTLWSRPVMNSVENNKLTIIGVYKRLLYTRMRTEPSVCTITQSTITQRNMRFSFYFFPVFLTLVFIRAQKYSAQNSDG